jgi:hypothetical protein
MANSSSNVLVTDYHARQGRGTRVFMCKTWTGLWNQEVKEGDWRWITGVLGRSREGPSMIFNCS